MGRSATIGVLAACAAVAAASPLVAQPPPGAPPRPPAFPQREVDPAAVERGKALYVNNGCSFCHGADIRGGDGGPSLQRSPIVLNDQHGERIGVIVKNGVKGTAMPAFNLTDAQIGDIAEFLHSFRVSNGGEIAKRPVSIVVGDASAGRAFFDKTCAACHSATGDLAHLATTYPDPLSLQQAWIAPKAKAPVTATVTLANGQKAEGVLTRIDEFSLTLGSGEAARTIARDGDTPRVEVKDPLAAHAALLKTYADKDIHDLTAYLVTLK
jgi:mono/diheme cytochrome c family protein